MSKVVISLFLLFSTVGAADIFNLVQALDRNDIQSFKAMIRTIDDANTARSDNNKSVLMYASWIGNAEAVEYLVGKGADINAADSTGATAFHLAIWKDHTTIALYLLKNGASAKAMSNDGMTPADIAMMRSNKTIIEAIEASKPKLKSLF